MHCATQPTPAPPTDSDTHPHQTLWDAGVYKGRVYGVPINNALMVMFYNKDLLAKGGAKLPKTRAQYQGKRKKDSSSRKQSVTLNP
jgi:maltose-binding protein MalE